MILSDTHVHTQFSSDSQEPMENMVKRGIELGLKEIYFTDHMDLDFPKQYKYDFLFDIHAQQAGISRLDKKYSEITLYRGIELGLQPHLAKQADQLLSENSFDYVIGSVHVVDGLDPYYPEYWEGKNSEEAGILHYFETALSCLETMHNFDSFGHLDYIIRYAPSGPKNYSYKRYCDVIDAILISLIQNGKSLEMNTSGYKKNGFSNPHLDIIKRYLELGGENITIGSDGHDTLHLSLDFETAFYECRKIGLSSYTTYQNRKPIHHAI